MFEAFVVAMWLGVAADAGSSLHAFKYGAVEANPFIISTRPAAFVTQVAATTAAETWLIAKFHKKHPRWAKALIATHVSMSLLVTHHNLRVARELQGR